MPRQGPVRSCPHPACSSRGVAPASALVHHGFFRVKGGRRRRWRCTSCGRTCSSNSGTAYHRIQRSRRTFDTVAALSVEGVSKSAIARVMELSWNTVAQWQEWASRTARRFKTRGCERSISWRCRRMRSGRSLAARTSRPGLWWYKRPPWRTTLVHRGCPSSAWPPRLFTDDVSSDVTVSEGGVGRA